MDEGLSRAVLKVFVDLYNARAHLQGQAARQLGPQVPDRDLRPRGRAGRGEGHVHWTRRSRSRSTRRRWQSARPRSVRAHVPLPLSAAKVPGYDKDYIVVATTRPETMLGDTARRRASRAMSATQHLVGQGDSEAAAGRARDPDRCRRILRPEKGTGAVKITPAHDFNDFEVGKRHRSRADQHPRRERRRSNRGRAGDVPRRSTASRRGSASSPIWRRWASSRRSSRRAHGAARRPLQASSSSHGSPTSGT